MKKRITIISLTVFTLFGALFTFNKFSNINANSSVEHEYDLIQLKRSRPGDTILQSGDFSSTTGWSFKNSEIVDIDGIKYGHLKSNTIDSSIGQNVNVKANTDYIVSYIGKRNILSSYGNVDIRNSQNTIIEGTWSLVAGTDFTKSEFKFNSGSSTSIRLEFVKWEDASSADAQVARDTEIWIGDVTLKEKVEDQPEEDDNYNFVWAEDFKESQLNSDNWEYELGHIRGIEQQHYVNSKENVYVKDGKLTIKATNRALEDQYKVSAGNVEKKVIYDSGSIRTHGKQEFLYGRIEMKAKLPKGKGVFPAFWTLGSEFTLDGTITSAQGYGWPRCGEIDIMELIGSEEDGHYQNRTVYQTLHYGVDGDDSGKYAGNGTSYSLSSGNFNDEYHIFGLNWSKGKMEWYVDDKIVRTVDYSDDKNAMMALDKPQYVQLNLALGGSWPTSVVGSISPNLAGTQYDVDYVYYARNDQQQKDAEEYYEKVPHISGTKDIVMPRGTSPDLLASVETSAKYNMDYSINDGLSFSNKGGNTKVNLVVKGKDDLDALKNLKVGTYNLYYTAIPKNTLITNGIIDRTKDYIFNRKAVTLKVVDIDKSQLTNIIKTGEKYAEDSQNYTSYTMQYLLKSIDWGKDIVNDDYASQEYINNAYQLIQDGIQKLRKKIVQ